MENVNPSKMIVFLQIGQPKPNGTKRWCYRCDSEQHLADACRHKETICNQCNIKGNLAKVCRRSKQKTRNLYSLIKEQSINEDIKATANSERNRYKSDEDDDEEVYYIHRINSRKPLC